MESILPSVKSFHSKVRFIGVIINCNLRWTSHVDLILKKCSQRLYILRRLKARASKTDCLAVYNGLIRSSIEYAYPAFAGLLRGDAKRLQRVQDRSLKVIGVTCLDELESRRNVLASRLFEDLPKQDTFVKDLYPINLPSGRPSVPFCYTSLRQSSFIPKMSITLSSSHCD